MSYHSNCPDVQVDLEKNELSVTLSRIDKKNALNLAMYTSLKELLLQADQDPQVRAVVLSGAGGNFCAGNDLQDFVDNLSETISMDKPAPGFIDTLNRFSKPVIAAVSGVAVGVGTTMLLHCDFVYADDTAQFQIPFVQLGVCPEAGASYLLTRLTGHVRAMEWLLLGTSFSAREALADGLINAVVVDPLRQAQQTARKISSMPPLRYGRLKNSCVRRLLRLNPHLPRNYLCLTDACIHPKPRKR